MDMRTCECMGCSIWRGFMARPDFIAHYGERADAVAKVYATAAILGVRAGVAQVELPDRLQAVGVTESFPVAQEWCTHGMIIGVGIVSGKGEAAVVEEYSTGRARDLRSMDAAFRKHL